MCLVSNPKVIFDHESLFVHDDIVKEPENNMPKVKACLSDLFSGIIRYISLIEQGCIIFFEQGKEPTKEDVVMAMSHFQQNEDGLIIF